MANNSDRVHNQFITMAVSTLIDVVTSQVTGMCSSPCMNDDILSNVISDIRTRRNIVKYMGHHRPPPMKYRNAKPWIHSADSRNNTTACIDKAKFRRGITGLIFPIFCGLDAVASSISQIAVDYSLKKPKNASGNRGGLC